MRLRTVVAAAVLTLVATPALAFHCPTHMKALDDALAPNSLTHPGYGLAAGG